MHAILDVYSRAMGVLSRAAMVFCASCLALLMVLTGWMVFGRYVLNDPPSWAENSILILVLFVSAMGAGIGIRERLHLRVMLFIDRASPHARRRIEVTANALLLAFGVIMVHGGWTAAAQVWAFPDALLPISRGTYYLPMVMTGILITLFEIEILLELAVGQGRDTGRGEA